MFKISHLWLSLAGPLCQGTEGQSSKAAGSPDQANTVQAAVNQGQAQSKQWVMLF
jgi:hypothetical protein